METAHHHWSLVTVGSLDLIGCQQDNARIPVVTVDAQVHTPLVHGLVPDDIGGPHVTVDIITGITTLRPFLGIEGETHLLTAFLDRGHLRCGKGCSV